MPLQDNRPPLIVIIGPTAVGKTSLSLELAMRNNAEIVSADSRLFYRGMDIGTAKPTREERQRVPHHLIDFLDPDESFSLGEFQKAVYAQADDIRRAGRLPLLVGGTGQYVRSITEGWIIPAKEPDPHLRAALESVAADIGTDGLHNWLAALDPAAAEAIDHRNLRRTVRALEVIFSTGSRFSDQRIKGRPRFRTLLIGLTRPRDELYTRIDDRIDEMIANGFFAEVASLLANGYSPDLPSMTAIGYREACLHLSGELDPAETVRLMKQRTRAFVRRQANWFKSGDPAIHWFEMNGDVLDHVQACLNGFLRPPEDNSSLEQSGHPQPTRQEDPRTPTP